MLRVASLFFITLLVVSPTRAAVHPTQVIPPESVSDSEEDTGVRVDFGIPPPCQNLAARVFIRSAVLAKDALQYHFDLVRQFLDPQMLKLGREFAACLSEHPIEMLHTSPN